MSSNTALEYDEIIARCKDIYLKKMKDYGSAWRILRPSSLTDQIFIKAQRIRSIGEKGAQKVEDGIENEFIGIVNYALMALIQTGMSPDAPMEIRSEEAVRLFDMHVQKVKGLMLDKNHDYGEAWRDMRVGSLVDLILMKVLRVKQIEDAGGRTLVSEGVAANYMDMVNYALFALMLLSESSRG